MKINSSDKPTYNLKAVVQQTGLKPDTLRAWERRYGLPEPDRTQGGHRLYSDNDIATLKWLLARQDEGMSISRAVKLWHSLLKEGQDPFVEMPMQDAATAATAVGADAPVAGYPAAPVGGTIVDLRSAWIDACLNFDERRAENILSQAFAYYAPETVCFEMLQKAMAEIGNQWYRGKTTVQQEHFASALAVRKLDAMLAATPPPTRSARIVVACAPEDDHTFSPLLLSLLLRRQGFDVIYLGAKVPATRLETTIARTRPQLVIFSAQLLQTAANLLEVAYLLRDQDVMLAYGGLIFNLIPQLRSRIPAHFLGEHLEQVPQRVHDLLANPRPVVNVEPTTEEYQHTFSYFSERASQVEAEVWRTLSETGMSHRDLAYANSYMTRNILAALTLGDMAYIGTDMQWVEGLMVNYNIPIEQLHHFTQIYYDAARKHLTAEPGQIVVDWLQRIIATTA